ncbi:hypothetical protein DL95DRAFT_433406 [Leptodontidium sp. 2 PMI_412]|nr:hypothetical protein DL95DRAFT_433406 [Leptodontidium sp. 2 PMI_412]
MTSQLPSSYPRDTKYPDMHSEKDGNSSTMLNRPSYRRHRPFAIAFAAVGLCYFLWTTVSSPQLFRYNCHGRTAGGVAILDQSTAIPSGDVKALDEKKLVPLEAHIMSKCPDARDCLREMILPTMQRVLDKVNFTLSYIGTPTDNDGVSCMHGSEECMGNIIELCAAKLYPDPKIYLGFTMCLSRDYQDIPQESLVRDCALEHGMESNKLDECAVEENGGTALGMLRDSVRRSIDAGVTKSCTVRLNEEIYCIKDGGKWKDCPNGPGVNDLVIAVEKLYRSGASTSAAQKSPSIAH